MAAAGAWISDREYLRKAGVQARTIAAVILGRVLYPTLYKGALERQALWQHTLNQVFKKVADGKLFPTGIFKLLWNFYFTMPYDYCAASSNE